MGFIVTDPSLITKGSLWKYCAASSRKQDDATDYIVGSVNESSGKIHFGVFPEDHYYTYHPEEFLRDLILMSDPDIKLKTQLFNILSPFRGLVEDLGEIQDLLVELGI